MSTKSEIELVELVQARRAKAETKSGTAAMKATSGGPMKSANAAASSNQAAAAYAAYQNGTLDPSYYYAAAQQQQRMYANAYAQYAAYYPQMRSNTAGSWPYGTGAAPGASGMYPGHPQQQQQQQQSPQPPPPTTSNSSSIPPSTSLSSMPPLSSTPALPKTAPASSQQMPMMPRGDPQSVTCSKCSEAIAIRELEKHIKRTHLSYYPFGCVECDVSLATQADLQVHSQLRHQGKAFKKWENLDMGKEEQYQMLVASTMQNQGSLSQMMPTTDHQGSTTKISRPPKAAQNASTPTPREHQIPPNLSPVLRRSSPSSAEPSIHEDDDEEDGDGSEGGVMQSLQSEMMSHPPPINFRKRKRNAALDPASPSHHQPKSASEMESASSSPPSMTSSTSASSGRGDWSGVGGVVEKRESDSPNADAARMLEDQLAANSSTGLTSGGQNKYQEEEAEESMLVGGGGQANTTKSGGGGPSAVPKIECLKCKTLIRRKTDSVKFHIATEHLGKQPIQCKFCDFTEKWYPKDIRVHMLIRHPDEEEDNYFDRRDEMEQGMEDEKAKYFPSLVIKQAPKYKAAGGGSLNAVPIQDPKRKLAKKCQKCDYQNKNVPYVVRAYHAITKHLEKPAITCNYCSFTALWRLKLIREHLSAHHGQDTGTGYTDNRETIRNEIHDECFSVLDE